MTGRNLRTDDEIREAAREAARAARPLDAREIQIAASLLAPIGEARRAQTPNPEHGAA